MITLTFTVHLSTMADVKRILGGIPERIDNIQVNAGSAEELFHQSEQPPNVSSAATVAEIRELDDWMTNLMREPNSQARNAKAIDLHGKLDRISADLNRRQEAGANVDAERAALNTVMDRLLRDIFGINPDHVSKSVSS